MIKNTRVIDEYRFVFVSESVMNDPEYSSNFSEFDDLINDWMLVVAEGMALFI